MASLLPQQIPPITVPMTDKNGNAETNWWLFFYNMAQQVLGTQNTTPSSTAVQLLTDIDTDVQSSDATVYAREIANLQVQQIDADVGISSVQSALQLLQPDLPDSPHQAQPVQSVSVGASPFVYTAPFDGILTVTGGTVSAIALNRGAGFLSTGLTVGIIPVRRQDQVQVTWSGLPVMTFYPN